MCSTKYAKIKTNKTKRKIINGKCEFDEIGSFCACKKKKIYWKKENGESAIKKQQEKQ